MARVISLRQLSISVARALADGQDAATRAALVKDLGTRFEQDSVELAADLLDRVDPRSPEAGRLRRCWPPRACTRRCSRCGAGPMRCCAGSCAEGWGCDERLREEPRAR